MNEIFTAISSSSLLFFSPRNLITWKIFSKDFSLKLVNEGLQNKLQIYSERLGRQDKLISRLEEEIVHADEQCQEFLLYWNPNGDLKFINRVEHFLQAITNLFDDLFVIFIHFHPYEKMISEWRKPNNQSHTNSSNWQ